MAYIGVIIIDSKVYNMDSRLRMEIHKKLYYLDHNYFQNTSVGEMNTLLSKDLNNIRHFLGFDIKQGTHEVLGSIFALIYCITINPVIAISLLGFFPIFMYITFKYKKKNGQVI